MARSERARGWRGPAWLLCVFAACGSGGAPAAGSGSSSIVLSPDEATLWLTSPDDDQVVQVNARSLEPLRTIAVEGAPQHLAWARDRLLVTLALSTEVAFVDPASGVVTRVEVPCGGTRAVVAGASSAYVSCPNDDRVVALDLDATTVEGFWPAPGRPTALALSGDELAVSMSRRGRFQVHALPSFEVKETVDLSRGGGVDADQVDTLAVGPGGFLAAFQQVDHDGDRARPAEQGGYGSVVDGSPRMEPMLRASCGSRYAVFDGGPRVFSGPSALAQGDGRLWVVNRYMDDVAVLPCAGGGARDGRTGHLGTVRVGRGPRGIVLSADGQRAFIDVGFDHAVARAGVADLDGRVHDAEAELRRDVTPVRLDDAAVLGRSLFFDAVNTHLTPSGVVTCGSCHPFGGDDGLRWFLHAPGVGPKLRRTPPAWGARPSMEPYHWDGEFTDARELAHGVILALMNGDGLLIDTGAIAAWMAEIPLPPGRPLSPSEREAAGRGEALFRGEAGCASCHAGDDFVDGLSHDVVPASSDPDGALSQVFTPSLRAVRARAPYLHDGRAETLRDVLTRDNPDDAHGTTSTLDDTQINDLLMYLETL